MLDVREIAAVTVSVAVASKLEPASFGLNVLEKQTVGAIASVAIDSAIVNVATTKPEFVGF